MSNRIPFFICLFATLSSTTFANDEFLKFKLKNRTEALEAKVVNYDFGLQFATLVDKEGTQHTVEIAGLAESDKRLLVKALERQLFNKAAAKKTGKEKETGKASADGDRNANSGDQKKSVRESKGSRIGGVNWLDQFADAAPIARGGDSVADDKPILWFRVLGDLRGLM